MHRSVRRAPARTLRSQYCTGSGTPPQLSPQAGMWEAGQAGAPAKAKVWQASGAGKEGRGGTGALA